MDRKAKKSSSLERLRDRIDAVDAELVALLNKRAGYAVEIAAIKREANLPFHSPEREKAVLERISALNQGPFPSAALKIIFKEIISASLSLEEPLKVAYLGPEGTFTNLAALRHFGFSSRYIPFESIKSVFSSVERNEANYGLVPIENSNEGVVSSTLDMFMDYDLKISAEVLLEVSHNLLSLSGDPGKVKKIYSHPQAISQCKGWLEAHMPHAAVYEASSTSKAAEIAAKDGNTAAIASEMAARLHDLKFIARSIEDNKNNFTRFLVISRDYFSRTGNDKTSLLLSVKDTPGALYEILLPFKRAKINLSNIESRPSKRKAWEYIFFIDMEGHITDKRVQKAIEGVKENCLYLKHLGSYPVGERVER